MRYLILASDFDGTLATHGTVEASTLSAIDHLLDSGRKLLLVTGREIEDLKKVFPELDRFQLVVAENGGLLYNPKSREERSLAEPPNPAFLNELTTRGVPYSVGRGVVATWEPHQTEVFHAIRQLGLELQVSFNKGAVMVLPSGINKQTGLCAALEELRMSVHNVVGIGDAENDHVFLSACECGVAVANALPSLKERADFVTIHNHGAGVSELIQRLVEDDLASLDAVLKRNHITLGNRLDGEPIRILAQRGSLLFAGPSGSGKSTAATGVLEAVAEDEYQFCLVDPEGDYEDFMGAVQFGSPRSAPEVNQVRNALEDPKQNVVVNLLDVPIKDRPLFFAALLPQVLDLRARTGRPHWVVVDEAHHMLPSSWVPAASTVSQSLGGMVFITVHPESMAAAALENVNIAVAVGKEPEKTLGGFAKVLSIEVPAMPKGTLEAGQGVVWDRSSGQPSTVVKLCEAKAERRRHLRKYADGSLGPDKSFYFRGPQGKLKLRAHNLHIFNRMAEGVDDETWLFHLRESDYSRWFRECIKNPELADEAEAIEKRNGDDAAVSRKAILAAVEHYYTAAE